MRGLYTVGILRYKTDWVSFQFEGKLKKKKDVLPYRFCPVLFCIWGQFPSISPPGAYIRRGDLTEGFLRYDFGGGLLGGLIFGGAYFRNFTVAYLISIYDVFHISFHQDTKR